MEIEDILGNTLLPSMCVPTSKHPSFISRTLGLHYPIGWSLIMKDLNREVVGPGVWLRAVSF